MTDPVDVARALLTGGDVDGAERVLAAAAVDPGGAGAAGGPRRAHRGVLGEEAEGPPVELR